MTRANLGLSASATIVGGAAVCFCLLFFWPGTFGGRFLASGDALVQGVPAIYAPAHLWEPNMTLGHPLYADPNEIYFYPLAIGARAFPAAFNFFLIAPFVIAQCALFALAWRYTRSIAAATVAAFVFSLGGFMISHFGHANIDHPAAWSVVFVALLEELRLRPGRRWAVAAASVALALCAVAGQPQVLAFALGIAAFFTVAFARTAPGGGRPFVGRVVASIALGLMLAAVLLVPQAELAAYSARRHLRMDDMLLLSMPLPELPVRLLFPHLLDGDYRGGFTELSNLGGVFGLMLAFAGATSAPRDGRVRFWCVVALAGLALSLGGTELVSI
jgi:hypothetical protein